MLIKMITTLSGPEFSAQPGQEIEVDTVMADQLISGGFAVPVKSQKIETAVIAEPENTIIHQHKGRGRR